MGLLEGRRGGGALDLLKRYSGIVWGPGRCAGSQEVVVSQRRESLNQILKKQTPQDLGGTATSFVSCVLPTFGLCFVMWAAAGGIPQTPETGV